MSVERAIIYAADPSDLEAVDRCMRYVQRNGFRLVGIVQEWPVVESMLADDAAEYVVVDRRTDIPVDPRVRIAADEPADERPNPRRPARSSRLNRRSAGA